MDSILTSVKKLLGIAEDYAHFDADIVMCVNSALSVLTQVGVGPAEGFMIRDGTAVWGDFIPQNAMQLEMVKSYVHKKAQMLFDPPLASAVIKSIEQQLEEFVWRIQVAAETG